MSAEPKDSELLADAALAIGNLQALQPGLRDDQPSISSASNVVYYDVSFDTNFADRTGFASGLSTLVDEAKKHATLTEVLENGAHYCNMLYTWRSCSRAIPAVKSDSQSNRADLYQKTVDVLGPEIAKLRAFYTFQENAIATFGAEVSKIASPQVMKEFVSQTALMILAKMISMFAVLNELKNVKACLNNDFSLFRRAAGFLKGKINADSAEIVEERNMSFFYATQNSLVLKLREVLEKVNGFEEVILLTMEHCAQLFEEGVYVLPSEKHTLLKAIAFSLYLMDSPKTNKVSIYKNKALSIPRYDAIFKMLPIVPLYGDMAVQLMRWVKISPSFDPTKWSVTLEPDDKIVAASMHDIVARLDTFRGEYNSLVADLTVLRAKVIRNERDVSSTGKLSSMALRGLKTVAAWNATIMELYSFKIARPVDKYTSRNCPDDADAYERALRYNFSHEELTAMVQLIAMIKDASKLLWSMESILNEGIRREIYDETQVFTQRTLRDVIRHVTKKKKMKARSVLFGIRATCADWLAGSDPLEDPVLKGERDPKYVPPNLRRRECGVGSTQLYMLRTMLESLLSERNSKGIRYELSSDHIPDLAAFYNQTLYYPVLLQLSRCVHEVSDLSQLWYREFFLELSMGERIQFPIDMSLPWILTKHVLESRDCSTIETVFYPMDLYNDSANFALSGVRKQFLYDEVEAEANLCFDQLIFNLSEMIFVYYKTLAGSILLNANYRTLLASKGITIPPPGPNRFSSIFKQRHFHLLGRVVDINKLLSQRLNASLKKSLDVAIARFEGSPLTSIIELERLIENNRLAHALLSQHISLVPFQQMLHEVNEEVTSIHGRISLHVFVELSADVLPNFCFNTSVKRFVKPSHGIFFGDPERRRDAPPKVKPHFWFGSKLLNNLYAILEEPTAGFIGQEHLSCLSRLLGYKGVGMIGDELLKAFASNYLKSLTQNVTVLLEGMPKVCKLPLFDYGASGCLAFYHLRLIDVIAHKELQTDVFHDFRELGNAVAFLILLEENMTREEAIDVEIAMPFHGIIPTAVREGENSEEMARQSAERMAFMNFEKVVSAHADVDFKGLAKQASVFTRERVCRGLCIVESVLARVKVLLDRQSTETHSWKGPPPANGIVDIDECNQFHRLWSAVLFIMCYTGASARGQDTATFLFGDGLLWAGCTLIACLGQRALFESQDFCYHIINVDEYGRDYEEPTANDKVPIVSLKYFLELACKHKTLNSAIFSTLEHYLPADAKVQEEYIPPPQYNETESAI